MPSVAGGGAGGREAARHPRARGDGGEGALGPEFLLTKQRGEWAGTQGNASIMATFHPSAALRAPEAERRAEIQRLIVEDLKKAAQLIEEAT